MHAVFKFRQTLSMIVRYVVSGGSGVVANLLVFSYLHEVLGMWHITAACYGFLAAYAVTFTLHKFWTFNERTLSRTKVQSLVYLASALGVLGLSTLQLHIFVTVFNMYAVLAQFIALGTSAVASFFFTSLITFHRDETRLRRLYEWCIQGTSGSLRSHAAPIAILIALMAGVLFIRFAFFPLAVTTDTITYVETARFIGGESDAVLYGERLLKPLAPALLNPLSVFTGGDLFRALLLESVLGFFALGFSAYWFGWSLFARRAYGVLVSLLVVTSYPIFRYGIDFYTETGIWAAYFFVLACVVRYMAVPATSFVWLASIGLLAGLLWKEYIVLAGLVLGCAILGHAQLPWRQKVHHLLQVAALAVVPWCIWQTVVYLHFHYSYLDWLRIGSSPEAYAAEYTFFALAKSMFAIVSLVWGLSLFGLWHIRRASPAIIRFTAYLALPSFGFLLWGYVSSRLLFSLAPLLIVLAGIGLASLPSKRLRTAALLLVLIGNSILTAMVFEPTLQPWLAAFSGNA